MTTSVGFELTATNEGLLRVLQQSTEAFKSSMSAITSSIAPVTAAFDALKGGIVGASAVLAGGEMFKEAVSSTLELAKSSIDLGMQLGTGATKASVLKIAMESVGITQDQVAAGAAAVTRALNQHEAAFQAVGIATKDANGNYRGTLDILLDSMSVLSNFKAGTDRNAEGIRLFGRAWNEIAPLIRLTSASMEEAAAEAKAFGLVIGEEDVERFHEYQKSMATVHGAMEGIWVAIGQSLLPELTALGQWSSSNGPAVVGAFRTAIGTLVAVFENVKVQFQVHFEFISAGFKELGALATTVGHVISLGLSGNFSGARAAWASGMAEIEAIAKERTAKIIADLNAAQAAIDKAFAKPQHTPTDDDGGDKNAQAKPDTDRMAIWQQELTQQQAHNAQVLAAQGQFHEISKAAEVAYWQHILATANVSAEEKRQILQKTGTLEIGIARDSYNGQLAGLKEQEAAYKNNLDAKLVLAKQYADKVGQAEGTESKAYKEAEKEVVAIEREKIAQLNAIDATRRQAAENMALAEVDAQEKTAEFAVSQGRETEAQLLAQEKGFEDQRYQIKYAALQKTLALYKLNPGENAAAIAQTNAQIEALDTAHAASLVAISRKLTQTQQQDWINLGKTIENTFTTNISKMLEGTETFAQGMRNIFMQIGDAIVQLLVKIAVQWAANLIAQKILGQSTAEAQIAASAGEAGAAGVASWAGAPWPIDAGAPAFGAAMAAVAAGFSLSEQGLDLPPGMAPPITQLHPEETVLPADIARVYRENAPGGRGGSGDMHFHIQSLDSRSVNEMIRSNKGSIAKAVREHARKRR